MKNNMMKFLYVMLLCLNGITYGMEKAYKNIDEMLIKAASFGDLEKVNALLQRGVSVNQNTYYPN